MFSLARNQSRVHGAVRYESELRLFDLRPLNRSDSLKTPLGFMPLFSRYRSVACNVADL